MTIRCKIGSFFATFLFLIFFRSTIFDFFSTIHFWFFFLFIFFPPFFFEVHVTKKSVVKNGSLHKITSRSEDMTTQLGKKPKLLVPRLMKIMFFVINIKLNLWPSPEHKCVVLVGIVTFENQDLLKVTQSKIVLFFQWILWTQTAMLCTNGVGM